MIDMIWQDIAITLANIIASYALIPQVYYGFKHKKGMITKQTGFLTTLGLYIFAISYFTLDLYVSTMASFITGSLWLTLFLQTMRFGIK